jgi:hypothetical protein
MAAAKICYLTALCKSRANRLRSSTADEDDRLVVTGYPVLDKKTEAIVVLGQSVSTKLTTIARQQEKKRPFGKK